MNTLLKLALSASLLTLAHFSFAVDYKVSGFASLYAGKVVDGSASDYFVDELEEENCPCFITNYYDATYYTSDKVSLNKDSTYGLKLAVDLTEWFSVSGQVEGLGGNDFKPELTWLYARFDVMQDWSVDVGRKALPLYYYSDFLNVRYAMPWVRVSGDIYGWPLTSYNGISTSYSGVLGEGHYRVSAWLGEEEDKDNRAYRDIYWGSDEYYIKWSNMVGLSFEYDYDWIAARVVAMTSKSTEKNKYDGYDDQDYIDDGDYEYVQGGWGVVSDKVTQNFYGFSLMVDRDDILVQLEANVFDSDDYESNAYSIAAGYRFGNITPMVGFSAFKDKDPDFGRQINTTTSLVVRWDFIESMAFKAQYDFVNDKTQWDTYDDVTGDVNGSTRFTGDSQVVTLGVDYVF